jgi:hypothetical protein
MKISEIKIGAVIPTGQYQNIQPEITISDINDLGEASKIGIEWIKGNFERFSEKGAITDKEISVTKILKKSFNEGIDVSFEAISHSYSYRGKNLTGATDYIDRFYKPFNAEVISKTSANAWGVDPTEVKNLWDSNGDLTSSFGTVVHKALEHYNNFQDVGAQIAKKKGISENYGMPKHPILQNIVKGFAEVNKTKGDTYSEVLVSNVEMGICGTADLILVVDAEKKICRVQDYKINVNSEETTSTLKALAPFNTLPANKLTKYQLQLSVYANLLEKSGWTVTGLDVFVYEDTWKHFELPVLQVI